MKQFIWGAASGVACTLALAAFAADVPAAYKDIDRFAEAFQRVRANYVHEIGTAELVDKAISGMASALDPHSSYMNAKAYADAQSATRPQSGGAGLTLTSELGTLRVVSPIDGGPAAAAGIRSGDYILAIDGQITQGLDLAAGIALLRGPTGSQITLTTLRGLSQKPQTITLTRQLVQSAPVSFEARGNVGYIRLTGFDMSVSGELRKAVRTLKREIGPALKGYILDLRDNPGGLLDACINVGDEFLESGNIVSARGRNTQDTQRYDARGSDIAEGKPIIVLVNEGTASGSEIVAGALQDNKRATVIGMKTFGMGTIQTIIPIETGGALRLTTAEFYTPLDHAIQATGIMPDILVSQYAAADDQPYRPSEAMLRGHFEAKGPVGGQIAGPVVRPEPGNTPGDFQLAYALERMNAPVPKP
jgi:carboxyl-terminal processing protease